MAVLESTRPCRASGRQHGSSRDALMTMCTRLEKKQEAEQPRERAHGAVTGRKWTRSAVVCVCVCASHKAQWRSRCHRQRESVCVTDEKRTEASRTSFIVPNLQSTTLQPGSDEPCAEVQSRHDILTRCAAVIGVHRPHHGRRVALRTLRGGRDGQGHARLVQEAGTQKVGFILCSAQVVVVVVFKAEPAAKTKANSRKSEPTANGATAESPSNPSSSSSRTQVSDVVRARTHVNQDGGVQKLCHQHHQPCKGALLQCTFMRAPGKRCQVRYCFSSLRRFYDQDPETIVKSNRMMVNPAEHCPPTEAKYAWKCPRCRKKCDCATCRKAAGLEPLGRWGGSVKTSDSTKPAEPKAAKGKAKAQDDAAKPAKVAAAKGAKGAGAKGKERTLAEAVAAAHKNTGKAKSKASSKANGADEDDGIHTPPPQGSAPAAKKKNALASILSGGSKAPILKTLKLLPRCHRRCLSSSPPSCPRTTCARACGSTKHGALRQVWPQPLRAVAARQVRALDARHGAGHARCLLKTIAGLTNIDKGHPTKPFVMAITSFRTHGKSLQRGEPWAAATELLGVLGLARTPLPHVEHDIPVEVEAAAAERSPSPPAARVTRARRAKENRQYDMARQLSMLDEWEAEEFGEAGADDDDDDDAPRGNGRARGSAKKVDLRVR